MNYLPLPIPGESPLSVVLRCAQENGYSSASKFIYRLIKSPAQSVLCRRGHFAKRLAELYPERVHARLLACFFQESSSISSRKPVRVLNAEFPGELIRFFYQPVCPQCAAEGYYRAETSVALFEYCTKHGRKLVRTCPECDSLYGPGQRGIDQCSCKAKISTNPSIRGFAFGERRLYQAMEDGDQAWVSRLLTFVRILEIEREPDYVKRSRLLSYAALLAMEVEHGVRAFARHQQRRYPHLIPRVWLARLLANHSPARQAAEDLALRLSRDYDLSTAKATQEAVSNEDLLLLLDSRAASAALGITHNTLTSLSTEGILKRIERSSIIRNRYSSHEISALMTRLSESSRSEFHGPEDQTRTQTYADELAELDAKVRIVGRFDIARGLPSLRSIKIKDAPRTPSRIAVPWAAGSREEYDGTEIQSEDEQLTGLQETADRLGTYLDAVRRVEKTGLLSRHVPSGAKARQPMMFAAKDVEAFDRLYVFVGNLATQLATGATSLSDKLAAVGVHPVSGPRIDGALVNVFRRSDIGKVDLEHVKTLKDYPTRAGRKPAGRVTYDQTVWMTAVEAADELALNTQQIAALQRSGYLQAEVPPHREADNRKYFRRTAVKRLEDELASLRTIESVALEVGLTKREFVVRFIESGFIECAAPLGEVRVRQSDLPRIQENLKRFLSTAQAGTVLNTHSRYLLTAERGGRITRAPENETQIRGVVLFRRIDVLQMANAGEMEPIRRGVSRRLKA